MAHFVEYILDDGEVISIETKVSDRDFGPMRGQEASEERHQIDRRFRAALATLQPVVKTIRETFEAAGSPSQVEVTFGVKFTATAGVILASADSTATLQIKIKSGSRGEAS